MSGEAQAREAFKKFDADGSETITGLELIKVLRECPGVESDSKAADLSVAILSKCDKNKDSKVTWDEFIAAFNAEAS